MEQLTLFGESTPIENSYMPQIDLKALYAFAKEQAQLHWNREFDIEIELVQRKWRRRQACYSINLATGISLIKMSAITNARLTWEQVQGNLLHELVHWHLHTTGQPFGDDDIAFAQECLHVGAPFSGTKVAQQVGAIAVALSEGERT